MVGFAVVLEHGRADCGGGFSHDSFDGGEDLVGEHLPPVFGHEHQMHPQQMNSRPAARWCGHLISVRGSVSVAGSAHGGGVKSVIRVKLRPTAVQADALARTLVRMNEAANAASVIAFEQRVFHPMRLQKATYGTLKTMGLSAQPAIHAARKAADGYATLHANAAAGNLGKRGTKRLERAMGKPIQFRADAAQSYDDRSLSWDHTGRTVSIWTLDGRIKPVPFTGNPEQLSKLAAHRQGQTDLVSHQGDWFLIATLDIPAPPTFTPAGFIGVDLGIVNIATLSTGATISGARVTAVRNRNQKLRTALQQVGTKSARRKLRNRAGREARFVTDTNHVISKRIVTEAQRTGKGIAVEDLTGIGARVRLRKPQRVTWHAWAVAQLVQFLAYKAEAAGVPIVRVDPAYTSQQCSECGHADKKNRPDQATFACRACGVSLHADENASRNIATRGAAAWGEVTRPNVAA